MDKEVIVLSASLGGFDKPVKHVKQTVEADYFTFTDDNFPPRDKSMTARLQAKIPKMFGWQLKPGYKFYLWLDGNLRLAHPESLQYFLDTVKEHDIAVLKHPRRDTIHWEYRYNWRGLFNNAPSNYLRARYTNEFLDEQYEVTKNDPDYKDDLLVNGGIIMYRNTSKVQDMFKEWWYHVTRYLVMDQLSFPYVLKKSGLRVNVLSDRFDECKWLENVRHAK